jgi:predicted DNA-binding protein (MmcQ/YjbR family)
VDRRQQKAAERLKSFALELPEAWEDHPWGDTVVKVGKKVFVFLGSNRPQIVHVSDSDRRLHDSRT